jgi:hypothetical protein
MKRERVFVFYPFLVGIFGVLALAASNASEVAPADLARPLGIAIVVASVGCLLGALLTREWHAAALIALAVVLWFSCYSFVVDLLAHEPWLQPLSAPRFAVPLLASIAIAIAYAGGKRLALYLRTSSRYLNRCALIMLLFPMAALLNGWRRIGGADANAGEPEPMPAVFNHAAGVQHKPDIYLIVLDEYTGTRSLAQNYDFDNRSFEDSLRALGFVVPRAPRSNNLHTHLALASLLNWELLESRPSSMKVDNGALKIDYRAIEDNRTSRYLHQLGYRFVFFPSAYRATAANRNADVQIPDPVHLTSEFERSWYRSTPIPTARRWWCRRRACNPTSSYKPPQAELIEWKFDQLAKLSDSAGPIFAFAHFVTPHWPYMFESDCRHREPYRPPSDSGAYELPMKRAYVAQIQCINRKVLDAASRILAESEAPPIIIIQADHGHGRLGRDFPSLAEAGAERVDERIDPFAAYYLPGHPSGVVYDSITPVNVLPRVLNHYFDAQIPLQPDATFWSTWDEPFKFTRIR